MITKTRVTELAPGDVVDFDAHTGLMLLWDGEPVMGGERPSGSATVTSIARSTITGNRRQRAYIVVGFDNGRSLSLFTGSKLPVLS